MRRRELANPNSLKEWSDDLLAITSTTRKDLLVENLVSRKRNERLA
jgi:hypothetical protein